MKVEDAVNGRCRLLRCQNLVFDGRLNLKHRLGSVTVHACRGALPQGANTAPWLSSNAPESCSSDEGLAHKFRANSEGVPTRRSTDAVIEQFL